MDLGIAGRKAIVCAATIGTGAGAAAKEYPLNTISRQGGSSDARQE